MKRYIIVLSLALGAVFTVVPADTDIVDIVEDITYGKRLEEAGQRLKDKGQAALDVAATKATALKEAGKSAARTGWRGFVGTGVPFATTTDVQRLPSTETEYRLLSQETPYSYGEWMGTTPVPVPGKLVGRRRNVTLGEAGEATADLASRGYYGTMAGLDAGVDAAGRGVRALGRGAQRGYYGAMAGLDAGVDAAGRGVRAAGRGVQRGWRGFVNTGVPGTTVTYSDFPEAMGEWPETVERQRRMRIGEVPGAVKAGAQRGWRGFVDTGVPLTGVTEYSMSPYEMDESMGGYFAPRRQVATQRRRTFGEVGEAIQGVAGRGYGAARGVAGAGYGKAAAGARAAYGVGAKGAGYVGRGIGNIPVLGTTATDVVYSAAPEVGAYLTPDEWYPYRTATTTTRRKTLGEKAGEWYGAIKDRFSSQKKK